MVFHFVSMVHQYETIAYHYKTMLYCCASRVYYNKTLKGRCATSDDVSIATKHISSEKIGGSVEAKYAHVMPSYLLTYPYANIKFLLSRLIKLTMEGCKIIFA